MKVTVQVVLHAAADTPSVVREVFSLDREALAPDTLGLRLSETKDLLAAVQDTLVENQVSTAVAAQVACPHCGRPRRHKDQRTIVVRSLFGTLRLPNPPLVALPLRGPAHPTRTFRPLAFTDGGEDIRDLPLYLNPGADHLLDCFHITMRLTVMTNMAKSLPPLANPDHASPSGDLATSVGKELERIKWFLWHGNVFRALQTVQDLEIDLDVEEPGVSQAKLFKTVREFGGYIQANTGRIPNYGERHRAGETISTAFVETAFVESAVNQVISKRMVKKQQIRWTPAEPTCCSRSAPESSTTTPPTTSTAGTPTSPTPPITRSWPRSLPHFVPLSPIIPAADGLTKLTMPY